MNSEKFVESIHELHERLLSLTASKGEEYKRREDNQFANFERGASSLGLTREQVLMVYLSKHLDSIVTYVKDRAQGQEKQYAEPISGRIDDAILYLLLLRGMTIENDEEFGRRVVEAIERGGYGPVDHPNCRCVVGEVATAEANFGGVTTEDTARRVALRDLKVTMSPVTEIPRYAVECPVDFSAVKPDPVREAFQQMADNAATIPRELEVGGVTTPRRTVVLEMGPEPTVGTPVFVISRSQPDAVEECRARYLPVATSALSTVDQLRGVKAGAHVVFIHHGNSSDDAFMREVEARCEKQSLRLEVVYK